MRSHHSYGPWPLVPILLVAALWAFSREGYLSHNLLRAGVLVAGAVLLLTRNVEMVSLTRAEMVDDRVSLRDRVRGWRKQPRDLRGWAAAGRNALAVYGVFGLAALVSWELKL